MNVRLTPAAVSDMVSARDHYAAIDPHLAEGFLDEIDRVVERLEMFPQGAPPVEGLAGVRRARRRRFPYGVFYRVLGASELEVLRVLHAKRDMPSALSKEET